MWDVFRLFWQPGDSLSVPSLEGKQSKNTQGREVISFNTLVRYSGHRLAGFIFQSNLEHEGKSHSVRVSPAKASLFLRSILTRGGPHQPGSYLLHPALGPWRLFVFHWVQLVGSPRRREEGGRNEFVPPAPPGLKPPTKATALGG